MRTLEYPKLNHLNPLKVSANPFLKTSDDNGYGTNNKQRIVLVSPFESFNFLTEHTLQQISKNNKAELDIVNISDLPNRPYLDVSGREKKKENLPNCVIDFYAIGVKDGENIRLEIFEGYSNWILDTINTMNDVRTRYLIPHLDGELRIRAKNYKIGEIFDPYSFRVSDLGEMLKTDLACLLSQANEGFHLFSEVVAKKI